MSIISEPAQYLISTIWSKELIEYATERYAAGSPIMSDMQFDMLEKQFKTKQSPTEKNKKTETVGSKPSSALKKAKHFMPMGSLEKANTREDIIAWVKTLGKNPWPLFYSDKLDGISIDEEYEEGNLISAVTRGDGAYGEEITRNVVLMKGVKKVIKNSFTGHLRGEIIIKKSDFHNFPDASNTRNSAAGAAKSIHDNSKCRFCTVLFYRVFPHESSRTNEYSVLDYLGLDVPRHGLVNSIDEIFEVYDRYNSATRKKLDYDIDGLVFEVNDVEKALSIGTNLLHPEYAIALKFPNEEGETILRAVEWQVGNTGRITPVAVFDEVSLAGARIGRASLATVGLLRSKQVSIGAHVIVSRRNDVIPMVERVITGVNTGNTKQIKIPTKCPSCGHELIEEGEYIFCPNSVLCPAQIQGAILNYTKKIGVLEWGDTVVESICRSELVHDLSDIYKLSVDDLANVVMFESGRILGEKNARTMTSNLHAKNVLPIHVLIGALGIKGIGRTMCKLIVDAGYDTIDKMQKVSEESLAEIPGFGQIRAREFVLGFDDTLPVLSEILEYVKIIKPSTGSLKGISVCMTGFRDPDMVTTIENKGGSLKTSVGAGLTYLVQKDRNSVSEKSKKALSHGVKVISIDDMWNILRK